MSEPRIVIVGVNEGTTARRNKVLVKTTDAVVCEIVDAHEYEALTTLFETAFQHATETEHGQRRGKGERKRNKANRWR